MHNFSQPVLHSGISENAVEFHSPLNFTVTDPSE